MARQLRRKKEEDYTVSTLIERTRRNHAEIEARLRECAWEVWKIAHGRHWVTHKEGESTFITTGIAVSDIYDLVIGWSAADICRALGALVPGLGTRFEPLNAEGEAYYQLSISLPKQQ
jgi:hypothetical protein